MNSNNKEVFFTIPGPPKGKARPRVTRAKNGASITYTPDVTVAYEELVRTRYLTGSDGIRFQDDAQLEITIRAFFPIPKSKSQRVRSEMLDDRIRPTKKPDCDNIVKIICDALNGIAYKDDAQVVRVCAEKLYDIDGWVSVTIQDISKKEIG